ncbi:MAG: alpha/beta fold hydrolase [Anaerolineaceae bacterium]|nr:alpha/beta fold hydrolase [Anaerolineaceae bacterium]
MIRRLMWLSVLLLALSMIPGVDAAQNKSPVFVLVHGAFQDSTGWTPVIDALKAQGYEAIAVEWVGRGTDKTPFKDITMTQYRDAVIDVIKKQNQPVILVGHSFGGMVISDVAETIPDRIQTLVYLAAYLPRNGDNLLTLSGLDKYSILGQKGNFIVSKDFTTASIPEDVFPTAFCPDCNPDQLKVVAASQLDEPLAPPNEKLVLTDKNFGSVKKAYIMTSQDIVVSPQLQALMMSYTPVDKVYAVNAGHAAYMTVPDELARILIKIAS